MSWSKLKASQAQAEQEALFGSGPTTEEDKAWASQMMAYRMGGEEMLYPEQERPVGGVMRFDGDWARTPSGWQLIKRNVRYE